MVLLPQSVIFLLVAMLVVFAPVTLALLGLSRATPAFRGFVKMSAPRIIMNSFKIRIFFWFILFIVFSWNRWSSDESGFAYGLKFFTKEWQMSLFLFLCISVNMVLFSLRILCRSGVTYCNFFLMSFGILSFASCSSLFRATTAFATGMGDLKAHTLV